MTPASRALLRASVVLLVACGADPAPPAVAPTPPAPPTPTPTLPSLISRSVLFGNPDRSSPKVSPDGKRLAYLAPDEGVLNVFVGPTDDPAAAKAVTRDRDRGIRRFEWSMASTHVLFLQDTGGDENWHLHAVGADGGDAKDLTPVPGAQARIERLSPRHPNAVLVGLNDRDRKWHDLHRIDVLTGERKLVQRNDGFESFVTDDDFRVLVGRKPTDDGGVEFSTPDGKTWKPWAKVPMEDALATREVDVDPAARTLYMVDSRGRDTAGLVAIDLASGTSERLADDRDADVVDVLLHPTTKKPQAVAAVYEHKRWAILDPGLEDDFAALRKASDGDFEIVSRTLDDSRWVVAHTADRGPVRYHLHDRATRTTRFLFSHRKALEGLPLSPMTPVVIPARDGKKLVSYVTFPADVKVDGEARPSAPRPMVLLVHGGPWGRDVWGFDADHQWLANRGYAVLSVNFRGSVGFGKAFVNAGNRQWAGAMHDDLLDAVDWAIQRGITTADRVAIMGGSYGGYATLVGLSFTPGRFACGVDLVGPSNLVTLLEAIPPYWTPYLAFFRARVGDHTTPEGKKDLLDRSPLTRVGAIEKPLLIGQGANDPRVKQAESDQIVAAMGAKGIAVTYVVYPDEGHGFAKPANRESFNAATEAFLAGCLGGRSEPFGHSLKGSSMTVPSGAAHVKGLAEALALPR